jgi:hypothetical protein
MPIARRPRSIIEAASFIHHAYTKLVHKPRKNLFVCQNLTFSKSERQPCFAPKSTTIEATNSVKDEHDNHDCKRICLSRFFEIMQRRPPAGGNRSWSYFAESCRKETHKTGKPAAQLRITPYFISSPDDIHLSKRLQCLPVVGIGVLSNGNPWNSSSTVKAPGPRRSGNRASMSSAVQKFLEVKGAGASKVC